MSNEKPVIVLKPSTASFFSRMASAFRITASVRSSEAASGSSAFTRMYP